MCPDLLHEHTPLFRQRPSAAVEGARQVLRSKLLALMVGRLGDAVGVEQQMVVAQQAQALGAKCRIQPETQHRTRGRKRFNRSAAVPHDRRTMSRVHVMQDARLEIENAVENSNVMPFAELVAQDRLYLAKNQ